MNFSADPETFRGEVREFIAARAPKVPPRAGIRAPETAEEQEQLRAWTGALFEHGLIGADWPAEHGGTGAGDPVRDDIVAEELARAQAPGPVSGNILAARALIAFGSDEQRARYLAGMRSGADVWCQLFSEPGAGSDLASLRTRAVGDGAGYSLSGQKVWTTNGHWADYGYCLARTDPDAPRHRGISAFVVDMRAPGVTIRPLRELTGTTDFNEVFLDDVHVPAEALIGQPGQGWAIANDSLSHERAGVAATVVSLRRAWRELWAQAQSLPSLTGSPLAASTDARQRLMDLHAQIEALAALVQLGSERYRAGTPAVTDGPMAKLLFSEVNLALATMAVELLGPAGIFVEGDPSAVDNGGWQDMYLYARAYTIAGGSSEIMRNVIAERGLGLPR